MTAHTCVSVGLPISQPCQACADWRQSKVEAEREVILAAKAFYRRNPNIERVLANALDSAVGKLIALGDF